MKKNNILRTMIAIIAILAMIDILHPMSMFGQDRKPKVAVVLSGGGAKGAAHVGALKVIEQAGIKPDLIVGTSMGALIGGLYSVGYTPEQMDSILKSQDWKVLLSDSDDPKNNTLTENLEIKSYALTLPFSSKALSVNEGGLIKGINLGHTFHQLLYPYTYNMKSFDKLPVPFSCVAVDLVTAQPYEFHSGSLQDAMRASMSIPGVFTPVRLDSMVLVDGGLRDNYPTDVAIRMGADIIIGVSVSKDIKKYGELNKITDILGQVLDVAMINNEQGGAEQTDINIQVNVEGYSPASFSPEAIDTLLRRGEEAAMEQKHALDSLANVLAELGREPFTGRAKKDIIPMEASRYMEANEDFLPVSLYNGYADNEARVSIHYDNLNNVSALLGMNYRLPFKRNRSYVTATVRLGDHNYFKPDFTMDFTRKLRMKVGYEYHRLKQDFYNGNNVYASLRECNWHKIGGGVSMNWKKSYLRFGLNYNYMSGELLISEETQRSMNDHYITYDAEYCINTFDNQKFPTKGWEVKTGFQTSTKGLLSNDGKKPTHILSASGSWVALTEGKFSVIPRASYRMIMNSENEFVALENYLGGLCDENIFKGQRAFAGVTHLQVGYNNKLFIGATDVSYNIYKKHYAISTVNVAWNTDIGETLFESKMLWGAKIGYMYRSAIGPLSLEFHYSNMEEFVQPFFNIGFQF